MSDSENLNDTSPGKKEQDEELKVIYEQLVHKQMTKSQILIGIIGCIGSGKTTVAEYLTKYFEMKEYSFASPIKNIATIMGFEHDEIYGTQEEKLKKNIYWRISGREFLQKFGTEIGREMMPKVIPNMYMGENDSPWIRLFEIEWARLKDREMIPKMVVSDCRFEDEIKSIRNRGGFIVKIDRKVPRKYGTEHHHASEKHIDSLYYDICIKNNGTKKELYDTINLKYFKQDI